MLSTNGSPLPLAFTIATPCNTASVGSRGTEPPPPPAAMPIALLVALRRGSARSGEGKCVVAKGILVILWVFLRRASHLQHHGRRREAAKPSMWVHLSLRTRNQHRPPHRQPADDTKRRSVRKPPQGMESEMVDPFNLQLLQLAANQVPWVGFPSQHPDSLQFSPCLPQAGNPGPRPRALGPRAISPAPSSPLLCSGPQQHATSTASAAPGAIRSEHFVPPSGA